MNQVVIEEDMKSWRIVDDRIRELPDDKLFAVAELFKTLFSAGWCCQHFLEPFTKDAPPRIAMRSLKDESSWIYIRLDQRGRVEFIPHACDATRSHHITVRINSNGNIHWVHTSTDSGNMYGKHTKRASGTTTKKLREYLGFPSAPTIEW